MAILKCKMCGGELSIQGDVTVAECEYCGTKQTVPTADNEKKITLFARAERLRSSCEFDKAAGIYESIISDFPEEAEAYWGLLLCKYGIEYVDDPATGKKIPTCHRSSFESVMDDEDFEQVMENSDSIARKVYREEAKTIEEIRKGILEVSIKEEPYDVFICYKETDENGERTIDSVIAQDIYDEFTNEGYRVFFARITLEDKLGTAYEPYIFAALNSAKVMLAIGTDYDYFNAVWVKNEWSRFLSLIAKGEKKILIPCYKDIDAYDIPKEFKHLQAQDMGKVGAMQDLVRGVKKVLSKDEAKGNTSNSKSVLQQSGADINLLLKRVSMFLEDEDWTDAEKYCQKALDVNPESAEAYLGLVMAERELQNKEALATVYIDGQIKAEEKNLKRARQFADEKLKKWFDEIERKRKEKEEKRKIEEERQEEIRKSEQIKNSKRLPHVREKISQYGSLISAGEDITVGLKSDGTVVAVGFEIEDEGYWSDIVAVSTWYYDRVFLKSDGTVDDDYNKYRQNWTDIIAVSVGKDYTVGLKSDGTVVAVRDKHYGQCDYGQCDVQDWTDIVAVSAGSRHTVGLKSDGTVVATKYTGDDYDGQCDVQDWTDIVAVSAGEDYTVGLKSDGTVVAVGKEFDDVKYWSDIVAVSAGSRHTVGLKSDGTVVAVGNNYYDQCYVQDWKDIVAVSAGFSHTVGLKSDGTVVAVGDNKYGQCDVQNWKLLKTKEEKEKDYSEAVKLQNSGKEAELKKAYLLFASIKDYLDSKEHADKCKHAYEEKKAARKTRERAKKAAAQEAERQRRIATLNAEKTSLQTELANLKGLFTGKRRKQIEARLIEIDNELKKL